MTHGARKWTAAKIGQLRKRFAIPTTDGAHVKPVE